MKRTVFSALAALCFASPLAAQEVNIVYPLSGMSYPITDPATGPLKSSYFTASFSAECPGGPWTVSWGFDGTILNTADFYDMISVQQVWKLPGGTHSFEASVPRCGSDAVKFEIGN